MAENDGCDGQDLLAIVKDEGELRQYFLIIKEHLKFKTLIAMNAEPKDYTSSSSLRSLISHQRFDASKVRLFS